MTRRRRNLSPQLTSSTSGCICNYQSVEADIGESTKTKTERPHRRVPCLSQPFQMLEGRKPFDFLFFQLHVRIYLLRCALEREGGERKVFTPLTESRYRPPGSFLHKHHVTSLNPPPPTCPSSHPKSGRIPSLESNL